MLVLSRKPGETIMIGDDVTVSVLRVQGNRVQLGIAAPNDVRILRFEVLADERPPAHDRPELEPCC